MEFLHLPSKIQMQRKDSRSLWSRRILTVNNEHRYAIKDLDQLIHLLIILLVRNRSISVLGERDKSSVPLLKTTSPTVSI